jgi:tRNA threonylcarbamoyladenosine biosynthesis protein TsaE
LVEWPEKAEGTFPAFDIDIHLSASDDESARDISFQTASNQGILVLEKMHIQ